VVESGSASYRGFRFPAEIISHAVWLYHRFPLSFREVEELLLARGVIVSHETIRQWCERFGPQYAAALRCRRPQAGDKWHLDEVFIKVNGVRQYLWRGVDQDGNVLDILVQSRRDAKAAKRFMAKLMKKQRRVPRVLVTDKCRSYGPAHRELMGSVEHRSHKGAEQPGGKLASAHPSARTRDELLPLTPVSPEVPRRIQSDLAPFPAPTSSDGRIRVPGRDDRPLHHLGPHHRRHHPAHHGLNQGQSPGPTTTHTPQPTRQPDKLTTPRRALLCSAEDQPPVTFVTPDAPKRNTMTRRNATQRQGPATV
jgi:transposase-like protein